MMISLLHIKMKENEIILKLKYCALNNDFKMTKITYCFYFESISYKLGFGLQNSPNNSKLYLDTNI